MGALKPKSKVELPTLWDLKVTVIGIPAGYNSSEKQTKLTGIRLLTEQKEYMDMSDQMSVLSLRSLDLSQICL